MDKHNVQNHPTFSEKLLAWYDLNRRILPWREDPTPYHVWLSEIMLQQTQVNAVIGYYTRFIEALPDIAHLAACPEDRYLKLWEGLGYYTRVRNLHKTACIIMEKYGGVMPADYQTLLTLPGIGSYTAAAVASIAGGENVPAVDGNLLRIFARLTACTQDIRSAEAKNAAFAYYKERLSENSDLCSRPGDFNQALMDLGAGVCIAKGDPRCLRCPLSAACKAYQTDSTQLYPVPSIKKARRIESRTVFLIHDADRIILHKRPSKGLLAGLYEFPNTLSHLSEEAALDHVRTLGLSPLRIQPLGEARHIFTHLEWHMTGYRIRVDELAGSLNPDLLLVSLADIREQFSIPSAFQYYRSLL